MPPHLQLTLLNVPPALDATASLPRPQVLLGAIVNSLAYQLISHLVKYTQQNFAMLALPRALQIFTCPPVAELCRLCNPACASSPGVASWPRSAWHAADACHAGAACHPEPPVLPAQRARHQRDGGGRDAPLQEQVRHHRAVQAAAPRRARHAAWRRQRRQHAAHE